VEADEIIARIETDKVTVDIASPEAGVIQSYFAAEGDTVDVGANFFELDTDGKPGAAAAAQPAKPAAEAPKVSVFFPTCQPSFEYIKYYKLERPKQLKHRNLTLFRPQPQLHLNLLLLNQPLHHQLQHLPPQHQLNQLPPQAPSN